MEREEENRILQEKVAVTDKIQVIRYHHKN